MCYANSNILMIHSPASHIDEARNNYPSLPPSTLQMYDQRNLCSHKVYKLSSAFYCGKFKRVT